MECVSCRYEASPGWRKSAMATKLKALANGTRESLEAAAAIRLRAGDWPGDCARSSHSQ
jgi:hypothetical protein